MAKDTLDLSTIPQLTSWSSCWSATFEWRYLERTIQRFVEEDGLDLEPDFQRPHRWKLAQRTAYVEHVLRGGHSGRDLLFNHPGWMGCFKGPFVIVDGKQRLQSVRMFLRDEVPIFGGYRFSQCTGVLRLHHAFTFYINTLQTREQVLTWYLEINEGGTPHTEEELAKVRRLREAERSK